MRRAATLMNVAILFFVMLIILPINGYGYSDSEAIEPEPPSSGIFSTENIMVNGALEIEGNYDVFNYTDPTEKDYSASNFSLAAVEIGLDISLNRNTAGYILFSYEDEEDAKIEIDEGFIKVDWHEGQWYIIAGRQYVPFGNCESIFISDPLTLELGETRETALIGGLNRDWMNVSIGLFNGDVDETDKEDDHIVNYVFSANTAFSNDTFGEIGFGVSYMNNIAESDTLSEEINTPEGTIADLVGGYGAYFLFEFNDLVISAEYIGAAEHFRAGELSFDSGSAYKPSAFSLEGTYAMTENFYMGVRYGASKDGGDVFAEKVYGCAANHSFFKNTWLGVEVQSLKYENNDKAMSVMVQLGLLF